VTGAAFAQIEARTARIGLERGFDGGNTDAWAVARTDSQSALGQRPAIILLLIDPPPRTSSSLLFFELVPLKPTIGRLAMMAIFRTMRSISSNVRKASTSI
jgi:hypothetical protein